MSLTEYSARLSQVTWLGDPLVRVEFPSFQTMAWTLNLKEAASSESKYLALKPTHHKLGPNIEWAGPYLSKVTDEHDNVAH